MNESIVERVVSTDGTCVITALDMCRKREQVKDLIKVMTEKTIPSNMKCDLSGDDFCAIRNCLCDFLHFIEADLRRR